MSWFLILSLHSNPAGSYTQTFASETQCVAEMNKFIRKNDGNADVRYIGCSSTESVVATIEDEE